MQRTINMGLITNGAVVLGSPDTDPAQVILDATMQTPSVHGVVTPLIPRNVPTATALATVDNTIPVSQPASNNTLLLLAAGTGIALLLFGKKEKKVGSTEGGKKDDSLMPVLLIGGAAAAYWYWKNNAAAAAAPITINTGGADAATPPIITATPVLTSAIPITPPIEIQTQARGATAANNLGYLQGNYPQFNNIYQQMTDAEIISMYQYLVGYVGQGLLLYRLPNAQNSYPGGGFNTTLYDAIAAIRLKYNINI